MTFILFLLLFHHTSKKEATAFAQHATELLQSYEDGSVMQWLEQDQIDKIKADIDTFTKHPSNEQAEEIMEEISDLHDFDLQTQEDIAANQPTINLI